jgi:Holliday junction resolvase
VGHNWKGPEGEREVQRLAQAEGYKARRMLGAGRKDDVGDIDGMPRLCLQVTRVKTALTTKLYEKLPKTEQERINRRVPFGAIFARLDHKPWMVVMTPKQFWRLYHYALIGYDVARRKKTATMSGDDRLGPSRPRSRASAG